MNILLVVVEEAEVVVVLQYCLVETVPGTVRRMISVYLVRVSYTSENGSDFIII